MDETDGVWVPQACTLPTEERPLRVAEFDDLFAVALRRQTRLSPTRLRWELAGVGEDVVRDLAARESACCAFFTFDVSAGRDGVRVEVTVPPAYVAVLDALAARAVRS